MQLQDQLTKLESDASQHQKILSSTISNSKSQIDKLQEEKAVLQVWVTTVCIIIHVLVYIC